MCAVLKGIFYTGFKIWEVVETLSDNQIIIIIIIIHDKALKLYKMMRILNSSMMKWCYLCPLKMHVFFSLCDVNSVCRSITSFKLFTLNEISGNTLSSWG